MADFLGDLARQLAALVAVCDIKLEAPCFAALVEDLLHDRGRAFEVVVEDNDVGAFFCIAFCNGLSDTGCTPCDHGQISFQQSAHFLSFVPFNPR